MGVFQAAILSDIHFPYEGKSYYKALELMKKWPNLRHIYLNGDIAEIESVSSHPKTPGGMSNLLHELEYVNKKLDQLNNMFKGIDVDFIEGNHCNRFFRFIRDVAPQMWGMLHMPKLLKFDERKGWYFTPYGPTQWVHIKKTRDLYCRHEPLVMGANHAKGTAEKSIVSVIYGHVHQIATYTTKKHGPKTYHVTSYSPGWLGDITKSCFDYRGSKDNWASGFARIDIDEKSGDYEVRIIRL